VDVVVVNRGPQAVTRCLSALKRQTYASFEVTVSEGASVEAARETGLRAGSAPYVVFLDAEDVPDEELLKTLVQAQCASGADVVTCGLRIVADQGASKLHLFTGEAGGLGALSNAYGTVGLYRRDVLDDLSGQWPARDPDWPLLARLNVSGARIVSVPLPLVTRSAEPGSVERNGSDALLVAQELERALPAPLRAVARLTAGLAASSAASPDALPNGFARRAFRRLFRRRWLALHLPSPR
jgi:hypothetical protein